MDSALGRLGEELGVLESDFQTHQCRRRNAWIFGLGKQESRMLSIHGFQLETLKQARGKSLNQHLNPFHWNMYRRVETALKTQAPLWFGGS